MLKIGINQVCSSCQSECSDDEKYCSICGSLLLRAWNNNDTLSYPVENKTDLQQVENADTHWSLGGSQGYTEIALRLEGTSVTFPIKLSYSPIFIGRHSSTAQPQVDLAPYAGEVLGVSRLHVRIEWDCNAVWVTDLNSHNGTFIDGQKLESERPYMVHHNALLQLGNMLLRIQFC